MGQLGRFPGLGNRNGIASSLVTVTVLQVIQPLMGVLEDKVQLAVFISLGSSWVPMYVSDG